MRGGLARATGNYFRARALARSVTGLDSPQAWKLRKAARDAAPVAAIVSLKGLTGDKAWLWRERAVGRAPKAVLSTIAGMDDARAWALRTGTALRCREALDSMIGLDHAAAWEIREACLELWPPTVVKSLGVLVSGARGHELARPRPGRLRRSDLAAQAGGHHRHRRQPHALGDGGLSMSPLRPQRHAGPRHDGGLASSRSCWSGWSIAALLGAFLGFRPWRRLLTNALPPAREVAQAQTLIAIAGALMVVVIGHSTARAFGLVGLGGFIRFRSGIKDTRDAAVMFVMIGIGMACGLGAVPMAVVATLFAGVVLALFDAGRRARLRLVRVSVQVEDAAQRLGADQAGVPRRARARASRRRSGPGRLVMETVLGETMDAAGRAAHARRGAGHRAFTPCTVDEGKMGLAAA